MLSKQEGPIAQKDTSRNWIFTEKIMSAYKNDLTDRPEVHEGDEFQFFNGPYGGGRKFVVVVVEFDGGAIIARDK